MKSVSKAVVGLVLAGGLVGATSLVRANGSIDAANATIAAGAAPQQGAVTIEPCAAPGPAPTMPSIGTLGAGIGTMQGGVPAFPGGGSGKDGAFHAEKDVTLPGGTYEYTSFTVDVNVRVDYLSDVVIKTTGDVLLDGLLVADAGGLAFECAGNLDVHGLSASPVPGVHTFGGPIKIDVAGECRFTNGVPAPGEAISDFGAYGLGDVTVIGRGGPNAAPLVLKYVYLSGKHVEVISATSIDAYSAHISAFNDGGCALKAFGGDFDAAGSECDCYGPFSIEASGALRTTWFARSRHGGITYKAYGGPLVMTWGDCITVEGGDIVLQGATNLELRDRALVQVSESAGVIDMTAFGGDLMLEAPNGGGNTVTNLATGLVSLRASGSVLLSDAATVRAADGPLTVRAFGGKFSCDGDVLVESDKSALEVGASGDVLAVPAALAGFGEVRLVGDVVAVVGDRFGYEGSITTDVGALTLTSRGALVAKGALTAATDLAATSIGGEMTFDDCTIATASNVGAKSGNVRLETFGGATAARIAARRATIKSGDNATASGDVTLNIVTVPKPTVTTYLLPNAVTLKLGTKKGSGVNATGTLGRPDAWPTPAAGPFVLDVGMRHLAGDLSLRPNGRDREFKAPGVLLRVSPSKAAAGKGVFTLKIDGDLTGLVPADDFVEFRLIVDGTTYAGTVKLTKGKFKLGTTRGAVEELLYPLAVAATVKGGGKDALTFTVGFATDGTTPAAMQDLTLEFGDGFQAKVLAGDFVKSKNRFTAKKPPSAPGLTLVVVDFGAEKVQLTGKNLDLGAVPAGATIESRIGVWFGGDVRSVDVPLTRKGTKLTY